MPNLAELVLTDLTKSRVQILLHLFKERENTFFITLSVIKQKKY